MTGRPASLSETALGVFHNFMKKVVGPFDEPNPNPDSVLFPTQNFESFRVSGRGPDRFS